MPQKYSSQRHVNMIYIYINIIKRPEDLLFSVLGRTLNLLRESGHDRFFLIILLFLRHLEQEISLKALYIFPSEQLIIQKRRRKLLQHPKPHKLKNALNMVLLKFEIKMPAPLPQVWKHFSRFENVTGWDPNAIGCKIIKRVPGEIGTEYEVLSLFNGNESKLIYKTYAYEEFSHVWLLGENDDITADDRITFKDNQDGTTQVTYTADICLRGIRVLFTPFIVSGLNEIARSAKEGMQKKSDELFGKIDSRRNSQRKSLLMCDYQGPISKSPRSRTQI